MVVLKGAETDPSKGSAQFQIATETVYEGSYRGTIKDDVIGIADKKQMDEIFGQGGNDVIAAGLGIDKIKGGAGNDTIWGGANAGGDGEGSRFDGDVAFYSGALSNIILSKMFM